MVFCVLRCFAVFCGCFAGVLWCSASGFWKTETVFCGVLRMFCNVLDVFCECFCRHFLSERKLHNTVLRCIAQTKRILFVLCVLYTFWSVLCCFVKNAKNTRTQNTAKHHKTPQNTAKHCFWKTSTILLRDPLRVRDPPLRNLRVYCVLCAFATDPTYFWRIHHKRAIRITYCGCIATVLWQFWAFCVYFAVFCDVISQNTKRVLGLFCSVLKTVCVLRCFAVFCRCFVKIVLCNTTVEISGSWKTHAIRNTRAYCEYFVFSSVFRCFSGVFCVFCGNTAKHSRNTAKHPQNITKHPQNTTKPFC